MGAAATTTERRGGTRRSRRAHGGGGRDQTKPDAHETVELSGEAQQTSYIVGRGPEEGRAAAYGASRKADICGRRPEGGRGECPGNAAAGVESS